MQNNTKFTEISNIAKEEIDKINEYMMTFVDTEEPIKSRLKEFLSLPSKHIRPLLTILYLKAKNISISESHIKLLAAVELVHNASLIHDDIVDDEETRRGAKTLNNEFDCKTAVILGDYLLSQAMHIISGLNSSDITAKFAHTLKQMCSGEIFQIQNKYKIPTIEEYLLKTEQKTASLFQASIESACLLAGEEAGDLGKNFGIAFQIKDDISNVLGSQKDIANGIYNAPVIYGGLENLSDGIEKSYGLLNNYIDKAKKTLDEIEDNQYKKAIMGLLELQIEGHEHKRDT